MATVAPPPPTEQATDLLQKLSLDSQTTKAAPDATKKPSSGLNQNQNSSDRVTPLRTDLDTSSMCYVPSGYSPYYYGYDGSITDWDDYTRYYNPDGTGVYGDMYHGYGYAPYGPYSPAGSPLPTMGNDGQLYGPQHYQYPAPYYQSPTLPTGPQATNNASTVQGDVSTSIAASQTTLPAETVNGNANGSVNGTTNGSVPLKPNQPNPSLNSNGSGAKGVFPGGTPASGYQDPRFNYDVMRSPWIDGPIYPDGQYRPATSSSLSTAPLRPTNIQQGRSPNFQSIPNYMGLQSPRPTSGFGSNPGYVNRLHPNSRMYAQYGRTGYGYGAYGYDSRTNGRGWAFDGKYKPKGRGSFYGGSENGDGFNEMNRGPRARPKNQKGTEPVTSEVDKEEKDNSSVMPDREQYNKEDFPETYSAAKFFIIKSYSEDDVHKSIKYNVWASTPNGNKKLDAGYQEAQGKIDGCPVFLLFSVNTSGQFVGLAEMGGPVDFNKNLEYWQQDKWTGCFPLKWHIVKDVPNSLLKHITLENNENKPVTNSRDTQEVKLEQGLQMLKIFKDYSSKTSILDDFWFYEDRQKKVQEKKAKQQQQQQIQKQVWEGKPTDAPVSDEKEREGMNGKPVLQISFSVTAALPKESPELQANGECKQLKESELKGSEDVSVGGKAVGGTDERVGSELNESKDAPNSTKAVVTEKRVASEPNGCKDAPKGANTAGVTEKRVEGELNGCKDAPKGAKAVAATEKREINGCKDAPKGAKAVAATEKREINGSKDAQKGVKAAVVTDKRVFANGAANGCS